MLRRFMLTSAISTLILIFWALFALAEVIVDTAWVRRYDGPRTYHDYAYAMTIDDSGYVYVTGRSEGTVGVGKFYDYATIKYRPDGDTAWVRRYNGPANADEWAFAIAVDRGGCVYVTGYCDGDDYLSGDYATVKYHANGDTAWVRTYDGPGNGRDGAHALAVDDSGNVYVTGDSYGGTGTYYDYATIKYYPNGDTAWVRRYDGPGGEWDAATAVVVDDSGNVYVTGSSHRYLTYPHEPDIATVKYDPDGNLLWVDRYTGPVAYGGDFASAMAIDDSCHVYVTGRSWGSGTHEDWVTIKYYSDSDTAWVRRYNRPEGGYDRPKAIAVDASGYVYVTGSCGGSLSSPGDYATIKYHSNGDTAWVRIYDWPEGYWDSEEARAIAVDASGNVYVTGASAGSETSPGDDYSTVKYDVGGNLVWVVRYDGPGSSHDRAAAIAVDDSGNVYVAGESHGGGTSSDYATIKYFQYNNAPEDFSLLFPPNKAFTPRRVRFDWETATHPDPLSSVCYDLCVSSSYYFSQDSTTIDSNLTASERVKILDYGTYYWKVKAKDDHGAETWSNQIGYFMVTGLHYSTIGDFNADGSIDIEDVVFAINYLYRSGPAPDPLEVGDVNCDGGVDVGDVVYLINYLFKGGPEPSC